TAAAAVARAADVATFGLAARRPARPPPICGATLLAAIGLSSARANLLGRILRLLGRPISYHGTGPRPYPASPFALRTLACARSRPANGGYAAKTPSPAHRALPEFTPAALGTQPRGNGELDPPPSAHRAGAGHRLAPHQSTAIAGRPCDRPSRFS